jgi:hypothetical protein
MRNGKLNPLLAGAVLGALSSGLGGCMLWGHGKTAAPAGPPAFAAPLQHPIDILVIDERPSEETVADPNFQSGYAFTADDAPGQQKKLATRMGTQFKLDNGIPGFRILAANDAPTPASLQFTFVLRHWYAKWPLNSYSRSVLVEGELDVELQVSKSGRTIYDKPFQTAGYPSYADLATTTQDSYKTFVPTSLQAKANQVLDYAVKMVVADMAANWNDFLAADKS